MKCTPIRLRRFNNNMTSKDVYSKLGITKGYLYKIESGYNIPSRQLILKMSKLYSCRIDSIYKDFDLEM